MDIPREHGEEEPASTGAVGARSVSVFCRLKPHSSSKESPRSFLVENGKTIRVTHSIATTPHDYAHKPGGQKAALVFTYDRVYDETTTQEVIFEEVGKPLVEAVCKGINATVLAYGTTASGKTYTILGPRAAPARGEIFMDSDMHAALSLSSQALNNTESRNEVVAGNQHNPELNLCKPSSSRYRHWQRRRADSSASKCQVEAEEERSKDGLLPRIIFYLFGCMKGRAEPYAELIVKAAAMEVYNDSIIDLATGRRGLKIQKSKLGGVSVKGLHEEVLSGPEAGIDFLRKVVEGRRTAATDANAESSRSHFIFWLLLHETASTAGSSTTARLSVVDLAGSERLAKANTCGGTQVEGAMINKSLTCLGKVISCLASLNEAHKERASAATEGRRDVPRTTQQCRNARFIPYRDSKLTRILQDSLGWNSQTSIVLTCSQELANLAENLPTLRFGQRACNVKNFPNAIETGGCGENELQKDITRYQNYIRELASWGGTAIVKLTNSTRLAPEKLRAPQNTLAVRKTGGPSRRIGMKRAITSSSRGAEDSDNDEGQAGVVAELLSGFPAPPKALQLDFIKDDVAMSIRHRLQHDMASSPSVDKTQMVTDNPDLAPATRILTQCARYGSGNFQTAALQARSALAAPLTEPEMLVEHHFKSSGSEGQHESLAMLTNEGVPCSNAGLVREGSASGICDHASVVCSATPSCNVLAVKPGSGSADKSTAGVTEEASETDASRYSSAGRDFLKRWGGNDPERPKFVRQRQENDGGRSPHTGSLPDDSRKEARAVSPYCKTLDGREPPIKCATSRGPERPCDERGPDGLLAAWLRLSASWNATTSLLSYMKRLQAIFPGRAARLEALRRAASMDDAIRVKQKLLLWG